jgi:hypothetical protein
MTKVTWKHNEPPPAQPQLLSVARPEDLAAMTGPQDDGMAPVPNTPLSAQEAAKLDTCQECGNFVSISDNRCDACQKKAARLVELSETVGKKKEALGPPLKSPLHRAVKNASFKFVQAVRDGGDATAYGYTHKDGRAAMLTVTLDGVETWAMRWPNNGGEQTGRDPVQFAKATMTTAAKRQAGLNRAAKRVTADAAKAAALTASQLEAAKDTDVARVPITQLLPDGPPDHVCRAVEMLRTVTAKQYDMDLLKGEKHYGHRVALLRALFNRAKGDYKVAETGIKNLTMAFCTAVGVPEGRCSAGAFAARCVEIAKAFNAARRVAWKAEKKTAANVRLREEAEWTVSGMIIPYEKPKTRQQKAEEDIAVRKQVIAETADAEPMAEPKLDVPLAAYIPAHLRMVTQLNGTVSLRLERFNSQGALHAYDTGRKIVISVLTPTLAEGARFSVDGVETVLMTLLESRSKRTDEVELILRRAAAAFARSKLPLALVACPVAVTRLRDAASAVAISLAGVRLLENPDLGAVLMQLEKENSQGAVCVYNNGNAITTGLVASEVLASLRPATPSNGQTNTEMLFEAAKQLLNPTTPGVPVTSVAASHLTAVINCKENAQMATKTAVASGKKFTAQKAPVKKTTAAKKEPTERKTSMFRLIKGTEKEWGAFTTQKGMIVDAFQKAGAVGAKAAGVTRGALIAALPDVPKNNVSFYLSKWQAAGILEKLAPAE